MQKLRTWFIIPKETTLFLKLRIRDYLRGMNFRDGEITVRIYLIHGSQFTHTAQKNEIFH